MGCNGPLAFFSVSVKTFILSPHSVFSLFLLSCTCSARSALLAELVLDSGNDARLKSCYQRLMVCAVLNNFARQSDPDNHCCIIIRCVRVRRCVHVFALIFETKCVGYDGMVS